MHHAFGKPCPDVITASPVAIGASGLHSSYNPGPAAAWIAPATPPPGASCAFAAFTTASTSVCAVMSPRTHSTTTRSNSRRAPLTTASGQAVEGFVEELVLLLAVDGL